MKAQKKKVLVLMGGPSSEYEVSLNTGRQILVGLDEKKYEISPIIITKQGKWMLPAVSQKLLQSKNSNTQGLIALPESKAKEKIESNRPDVVFIAMHGEYGEDGKVQAMLESAGFAYTGSGVLASALGMDKARSSILFKSVGLNVPEFEIITKTQKKNPKYFSDFLKKIKIPCVVKPNDRGSSVGITIVKDRNNLEKAFDIAFKYSDNVMIQKFIAGIELTCGVLEKEKDNFFALTPTEILPKKGDFYDYKSKYADAGSEHCIPPRNMDKKTIKKIQNFAILAHKAIGCEGMSRVDFILSKNGTLYVLEVNTIPGMTRTSLLPEAAKASGIEFPDLLDLLVNNAIQKKK